MKKRFFSFLLVVFMLLALIPECAISANAANAGTIYYDQAQANINKLVNELNGEYFTVNQKACGTESNHGCSNCGMINVIKKSWLEKALGRVPSSTSSGFQHFYYDKTITRGQSCAGFANFAGWYIFSSKSSDTVKFKKLKDGSFNSTTMAEAKPGDLLRLGNSKTSGTHSAVFLSADSDGVYVLDSNWSYSSGNCRVSKHKIKYSSYSYVTISRAKNYVPTERSEYTAELYLNYSGKNYMPAISDASISDGTLGSRDTTVSVISADSTVKHTSASPVSLKIVNTSAGSSGKDLVINTYASARASSFAYCEDQTMVLSFWAKASSNSAKMYFRWGYESGYRSISLTNEWKYYTVEMDRTTSYNNAIHPYVNKAGTVWLSEVQLEEGTSATEFAEESGGKLGTLTVKNGGKYTDLPTPTRSGYVFEGWFTKPVGGEQVTSTQTALKGNVKLFAHWAANHSHQYSAVETKAETCTEDGYTVYRCTCGSSYTGSITTALGHDYVNGVCSRCGGKDSGYTAPHTHTYAAVETKAATCTEEGYTTYRCSCGNSYKGNITAALGHQYGSGVCTRCGAVDPEYTPPVTINFTDVKKGEFYYDAVLWAVENGITNGMTKTEFWPNENCTRGHVVTFLYRAAGSPEVSGSSGFTDVKKGEFYYDAVCWAVENGITKGITATTFGPDEKCTRGQVVTFLWRANGSPIVSKTAGFKDVKAGEFFYDAVAWAVERKITNGMTKTEFGPEETCTRGHVVTFLYRAQ